MRIPERLIERVALLYPGSKLFRLPEEEPREVVLETYRASDDSWSSAVAIIGRSELHFHRQTIEDYLILEGTLAVEVGNAEGHTSFGSLGVGASCHISPQSQHRAYAVGNAPAIVLVIARPAWRPDDHIVIPDWQ